jgi:hypothetical protein
VEFQIPILLKPLPDPIEYSHKILLTGSCFTEHIGNSLQELKFSVLQNPNGILFDPHSVCKSLISYIENRKYTEKDFFQLNEVWHSWNHHSRFSNTNLPEAIRIVNQSQEQAHTFLKNADWVIITLGSSFSYQLTGVAAKTQEFAQESPVHGLGVANCHRAPAQWFQKHLMTIDETVSDLDHTLQRLFHFNRNIKIIFTVSPVRHIRDGVVDNNRSKARLIESVHHFVNKYDKIFYFPAYELVIDVLRDYRFYDADLVHPNYMGTEFVLEKFSETSFTESTRAIMQEVKDIVTAKKHKAFQPQTKAHQQFLKTYLEKAKNLQTKYPFLNLKEEINYFSGTTL